MKRREFVLLTGTAMLASIATPEIAVGGREPANMYGLIAKITATNGQRDALIPILIGAAKEMPGCLSYIVAKDPTDANVIWITEVWDSAASHAASLSLPAVKDAITRGKPLIAEFGRPIVTRPIGGYGLTAAKSR